MKIRPKPSPWRVGEWPNNANATDSKPITTCPNCGAHSSGGHLCRPAKTTTTDKD